MISQDCTSTMRRQQMAVTDTVAISAAARLCSQPARRHRLAGRVFSSNRLEEKDGLNLAGHPGVMPHRHRVFPDGAHPPQLGRQAFRIRAPTVASVGPVGAARPGFSQMLTRAKSRRISAGSGSRWTEGTFSLRSAFFAARKSPVPHALGNGFGSNRTSVATPGRVTHNLVRGRACWW